jgi:hypothetical protein
MNIWQSIVLIILVNLLFFHRTWSYGYVSDDIPASQNTNESTDRLWKRIWIEFRGRRYWNNRRGHILTTIVHTLNCILIYLSFGRSAPSLMASLLFSLNPINTQGGSIWMSGKPYSTATLLVLGAYCVPMATPLFYGLSSFFSASAMFATLPFLYTKFWFWVALPFIFSLVFWRVVLVKWNAIAATNEEMRAIKPRKLIVFFKTFGYYFRLCLFPYKLGLYHNFIWGIGVNRHYNKIVYKIDRDFWIGLILFLFCLWHILFIRNSVSFGLFWFVCNISMFCNFVTCQQQVSERFLYLPCVGLMLSLSYFLCTPFSFYSVILMSPLNYILLATFFVYYATRLWYYRESYINDYWQVEYNIIEQKNAHYAWVARGVKKFYICDFDGALRDFGEARSHTPHDFKQNMNMAAMFLVLGDIPHCEEHLKYAEDTLYDGVEDKQREEFITHTKGLIEIAKKDGKLKVSELRIIK